MFDLGLFKTNKLQAIQEFCISYGLEPGDDCSIILSYSTWSGNSCYTVEFNIKNFKSMSSFHRRQLKRDYKLEVPSYAIGNESPPLHHRTEHLYEDGRTTLNLELMIAGAYECIARGEEEVEPPQYRITEAESFESMTPEQALEYVHKKAEDCRKPITRKTYSCRPI